MTTSPLSFSAAFRSVLKASRASELLPAAAKRLDSSSRPPRSTLKRSSKRRVALILSPWNSPAILFIAPSAVFSQSTPPRALARASPSNLKVILAGVLVVEGWLVVTADDGAAERATRG
eukprot:CAMPEP_0171812662 /NCGR_PEP_ID=MMETSP0991-20121206/78799_1 /TAXON_ID=483369 /ORGANISM="non described non described, Strain CCMP2098" /LENGTH=118 /DNA_ID=CAMNT_0012426187 /DNA_START=337 /DNA_END=689 /DNA_ORIENTATION=+